MLRLFTNSQASPNLSAPYSNVSSPAEVIHGDSPRILILDRGILLDELIMELICDVENLQILVTRMDKEETVAQAIVAENPQVVILSETDSFSVDKLNKLLEGLQLSETVQIALVTLYENSLVIKNSHHHSHTNFKDFINCIKNNHIPTHSPS